jgi:hypothetical protein
MKQDRYVFGWSDYRAQYGTPKVEWEPIKYSRKYEWGEYLAYVGMATGVSMAVAPMAWVQLIAWIFA